MADLAKVKAGKNLSRVPLVGGALESDTPPTIADGYHRICASYWLNENTDIWRTHELAKADKRDAPDELA